MEVVEQHNMAYYVLHNSLPPRPYLNVIPCGKMVLRYTGRVVGNDNTTPHVAIVRTKWPTVGHKSLVQVQAYIDV